MKKLLFIIIAIVLTVFLIDTAHGALEGLQDYHSKFTVDTTIAYRLKEAGFPQSGTGQYTHFGLYVPSNQELLSWIDLLSDGTITITVTEKPSSYYEYTARSSTPSVSATGLYQADALGYLAIKLKSL